MYPLAPFVTSHVRVVKNRPPVNNDPPNDDNSSRVSLIPNTLSPVRQTREHADRGETSADLSTLVPSEAVAPQHQPQVQRPNTFENIPQVDTSKLQYTQQVLGKGSFGVVKKASYGEYGFVAVKLLIHESDSALRALKLEIQRLHTYGKGSEHIVRFYGYIRAPEKGYAMEFMDCGSLNDLLNDNVHLQYQIDHVFSWLKQVALGARYMHSVSLVHRDLKPHNLLLRDKYLTIKIGDFGLVGEVKATMTNCQGSAPWMAPEVFTGKKYSTACDVYSLGIILWQMVTRKDPYHRGNNALVVLGNVAKGARPHNVECHPLLWKMIEKMWAMDPEERPSMDDVVEYSDIMMQMYSGCSESLLELPRHGRSEHSLFSGLHRLSSGTLCTSRGVEFARAHRSHGS